MKSILTASLVAYASGFGTPLPRARSGARLVTRSQPSFMVTTDGVRTEAAPEVVVEETSEDMEVTVTTEMEVRAISESESEPESEPEQFVVADPGAKGGLSEGEIISEQLKELREGLQSFQKSAYRSAYGKDIKWGGGIADGERDLPAGVPDRNKNPLPPPGVVSNAPLQASTRTTVGTQPKPESKTSELKKEVAPVEATGTRVIGEKKEEKVLEPNVVEAPILESAPLEDDKEDEEIITEARVAPAKAASAPKGKPVLKAPTNAQLVPTTAPKVGIKDTFKAVGVKVVQATKAGSSMDEVAADMVTATRVSQVEKVEREEEKENIVRDSSGRKSEKESILKAQEAITSPFLSMGGGLTEANMKQVLDAVDAELSPKSESKPELEPEPAPQPKTVSKAGVTPAIGNPFAVFGFGTKKALTKKPTTKTKKSPTSAANAPAPVSAANAPAPVQVMEVSEPVPDVREEHPRKMAEAKKRSKTSFFFGAPKSKTAKEAAAKPRTKPTDKETVTEATKMGATDPISNRVPGPTVKSKPTFAFSFGSSTPKNKAALKLVKAKSPTTAAPVPSVVPEVETKTTSAPIFKKEKVNAAPLFAGLFGKKAPRKPRVPSVTMEPEYQKMVSSMLNNNRARIKNFQVQTDSFRAGTLSEDDFLEYLVGTFGKVSLESLVLPLCDKIPEQESAKALMEKYNKLYAPKKAAPNILNLFAGLFGGDSKLMKATRPKLAAAPEKASSTAFTMPAAKNTAAAKMAASSGSRRQPLGGLKTLPSSKKAFVNGKIRSLKAGRLSVEAFVSSLKSELGADRGKLVANEVAAVLPKDIAGKVSSAAK